MKVHSIKKEARNENALSNTVIPIQVKLIYCTELTCCISLDLPVTVTCVI